MNKKAFLIAIITLLLVGGGYAVWSSFFQGISGLAVYSESGAGILYTSYLESDNIDVTDSPAVVTDYITVLDNDGATDFIVDYQITKTDVIDGCTDFDSDVTVTVDPISFNLTNGQSQNVTITYDVARWSCPQNVSTSLNITGTPT